jgi:predicted ATPase
MSIIHKDNYFILTGAMGAGKSTVINALRDLNLICIDVLTSGFYCSLFVLPKVCRL